jgi:hypothetical protein
LPRSSKQSRGKKLTEEKPICELICHVSENATIEIH